MRLRPRLISVLVGQGGEGEGNHPGMDILVVGDSLMRQLYSRLVHMLRGHRRVFDYKMHTHAAYSVCKVPLATARLFWRHRRSPQGVNAYTLLHHLVRFRAKLSRPCIPNFLRKPICSLCSFPEEINSRLAWFDQGPVRTFRRSTKECHGILTLLLLVPLGSQTE